MNLYAVDTSQDTSIAEKYWKMAELDHKIHLTIDKGLNFLEQSIKNNNNDFDLYLLMLIKRIILSIMKCLYPSFEEVEL